MRWLILVAVALGCRSGNEPALTAGAGGPPLAANQTLTTNATVRLVAIEGGCWALETSQGAYEPIALPAQFQVDGMQVAVVARGAEHAASICMMAPLVTLDSIRAR